MNCKVLILDHHAEIYRDRLRAEFPAAKLVLAHGVSELPTDLSDIDVLISFGIAPAILAGVSGWGAAGVLDLDRVVSLC